MGFNHESFSQKVSIIYVWQSPKYASAEAAAGVIYVKTFS